MDSKKLNIAIFIGSDLQSGGGFQYEYMVLNILNKYHYSTNINLMFYTVNKDVKKDYLDLNLEIKLLKENILQKIHRIGLSNIYIYKLFDKLGLRDSSIEKILLSDKIDLIYFLSPSMLSQGLNNIPYIFTLWDLGHLEALEFPEVSNDRQFESRELLYTKSLKKAFKVMVDSAYGKKYAAAKYNLDAKRVEVLKFLPNIRVLKNDINSNINIKDKYNLKNDYIFYPAQFWAHKNHIYILKAIKILREEKYIDIDVVFSGSNKGNLDYILDKAKEYKIDDLIHYIGFASNEEIPYLYKQSLSLVMPTYLGPTNIPPLEAFAYGTPVCYSDMPFFREQVGDAVFYLDLNNPYILVESLIHIRNDKKLVKDKIDKGRHILENWNDKDFYNKLIKAFNEYKYIRENWR